MTKGRVQRIFQEKAENKQKLEADWQNFLKKDTYLIFDEKQRFLDRVSDLTKYPRFSWFRFKTKKLLKSFRSSIERLKEKVIGYNNDFINKRLKDYTSFFGGLDDKLKYGLNPEQRKAIIKDDKHNLVIAGAGSGKTSVIASRIAYLVRRNDKVDPNRILALAFTKAAANEMKERIKNSYNIDIDINTFHALGRRIIYEETKKKPKLVFDGKSYLINEFIEKTLNDLLTEKRYQKIFIDFLAYHLDEEPEIEDFQDKQMYYRYMENKSYTSLNNIEVKSISEKTIANFFFIHNIKFEYEPLVGWVDESEEDKEYHPDFYLPDYDIYIEHWGLNEKLQVPKWFSISSEEYKANRLWKLEQFEKYQKTLIETWEHERLKDLLIPNLKEKLIEKILDIEFTSMDYKNLVEKTNDFREKTEDIIKLFKNFIQIAKSNMLKEDEIEQRLKSKNYTKRQKLFGRLALEIYKQYQNLLKTQDKIDFNDMINLAVDHAKKRPDKYNSMYDHLLIDEFQDISYQRMELVRCFVNDNSNTKLFCVGDDWQSIYQFTGSDLRYFIEFSKYFSNPEITNLELNYRSTSRIIEMSNHLISQNKSQINKNVRTVRNIGPEIIFLELAHRFDYSYKTRVPNVFNLVKILLDEGINPNDIMVLSRYNRNLMDLKMYCGANGIPIYEEGGYKKDGVKFFSAHKAKGLESKYVIMTDITSGIHGFPCEVQDSSIFELVKRTKSQNFIEEERRLFYVALTRSKEFLYLYSIEDSKSMFIDEIDTHLSKVHIDIAERWNKKLPNYLNTILKGTQSDLPIICPECSKFLDEKTGPHGNFLGCAGFPQCKYTYDIIKEGQERCPKCKRRMIEREGKHGKYMACLGYTNCNYSYDILEEGQQACPKCKKRMVERVGKHGKFLACTGYPNCKFTIDLEADNEKNILCPDCNGRLIVRTGKYGKFISCLNYPQCKFAFNLSKKTPSQIKCPKCKGFLKPRDGKFGKFLGCTNYPQCKFTFNLRK